MTMRGVRRLGLLAAVLAGAVGGSPATAAATRPWELKNDYCSWWLADSDGKSHRASIGVGEDLQLVLSISDAAFLEWPDDGRPEVELRLDGDEKRRVTAQGWVSHGSPSLGMFLNREDLAKLAGATRMEVLRNGRTVVDQPLAATPSFATLAACLPPMTDPETSDAE